MNQNKPGIHRFAVSIYIARMETIFDDLSLAIRAPRQDVWRPVRAFALDFAAKLAMGLAIGLGVGLGMAIAG